MQRSKSHETLVPKIKQHKQPIKINNQKLGRKMIQMIKIFNSSECSKHDGNQMML